MWKRAVPWLMVCSLTAVLVFAGNHSSATQQPGDGKKEGDAAPPTPGVKLVTNRVTSITIYPNNALVTREVDVPEGTGTLELTVNPMPPATITSSLFTEGSEGIRVLTTRFRTRTIVEDKRADAQKLHDEIKQLQLAREKLEGESKALAENDKTITKMESFMTITTMQSAEKGTLNTEAAIALSKHIREQRLETAREQVNLTQQIQANKEKSEAALNKLNGLLGGTMRMERDAVIVVEKSNAAAGKVRLNYLVTGVSWQPQYKLRAGKTAKDPVQVEYQAAITQQTGEDWPNVNLVLSTAEPMLNAAPPELQKLEVTVLPKANVPGGGRVPEAAEIEEQIRNLREKAQKDFNAKKQTSGVGLVNTAAALDQTFELFNPDAAIKRGCALGVREGPTVTYHLNGKSSVGSRNDEQVLEVARLELKPDFYYKAVPVLSAHVYRLADLTNTSEYILLPGDATMYIGADFVGQMTLPLVAIGEKFTAGFGVDPQLQVERQLTDKLRTTNGGNQSQRYNYRILVSSYKTEKVKLQVWDRLPHADAGIVDVALLKTAPDLSTDAKYVRDERPSNLLRWDVTVEPKTNGDKALAINYEFKMEHDRQMAITNFQTPGAIGAVNPADPRAALLSLTPAELAKIKAELAKLSPQDRQLAEAQVFCAVDQESPLGSMGPIQKVMIKNQPVFLCCKGCLAEANAHPDETLTECQKLLISMAGKK